MTSTSSRHRAIKPGIVVDRLTKKAGRVKLMVFDVDGTLTDGSLWFDSKGESLKRFNVKDGQGIGLARAAGIPVALLTGRHSKMVELRAAELQIPTLVQSSVDKGQSLVDLCNQYGLKPDDCAYMGDDLNDIPAMKLAAFSACPGDAVDEVKAIVDYVSPRLGGQGAVRDLVELILKWTKRWPSVMAGLK